MRRAAALAGLALALGAGCGGSEAPRADPSGSTLRSAYRDPTGAGRLRPGPPAPLRDRTELAPRARPGRTLAVWAQLTDAHVADEESPTRVGFLDRLGSPFTSTFRPQEALAPHVLAGAVRAVDALKPDGVLVTGDLVDAAGVGEVGTALAVLEGGRVDPDSGAPGYEGPQAASGADPLFYRPDVDAPRRPGLLERAQRPFDSPGLRAPWFPALGNHDLLVAGELPPTARTDALATGGRRIVALDPSVRAPTDAGLAPALVDRLLARGLPGESVRVAPDRRRRAARAPELLAALRRASGSGGVGPRLQYAFDLGPSVRAIVLDLVDRRGGSRGTVDAETLRFLRAQLRAAGRRWVLVVSHQPLRASTGGEAALAALDRAPRVLATVAGHAHRNRIRPRGRFWTVETASLIDFPQQARAFRLRATPGGGAALETWMLDHAPGGGGGLGEVARELSFLDAQGGRPSGLSGRPPDRNVRLFRAPPGERRPAVAPVG